MGKLMQSIGLAADPDAGAEAAAASSSEIQKAVDEIENLQIPDIEKQKLTLKLMSEAGFLGAEQISKSEFDDIQVDPALKDAQMLALEDLRERGEVGLSPEEKAQLNEMRRGAAADAQSQRQDIMQGMSERGNLDSGNQLAMQLAAQQGSFDNAAQATDRLAASNFAARRDALEKASNVASGIRGQDYQQESDAARAKDIINQFNVQNRQNVAGTNLGVKQQDVATKNQQQTYNKGLQQQEFQNKMSKGQMLTNARMGKASNLQQQAQAEAQASQASAAGMRTMAVGALAMSDKNLKEDIKPIRNMLDKLTPYEYNYKEDSGFDDEKSHTGVMAQDLEKSELGKEFVEKNENGDRMVDYGQMASTLLASNVDLHKRIKELETLLKKGRK